MKVITPPGAGSGCWTGRPDMPDLDLFGEPIPLPRRTPRPRGYAARPGGGPKGETCRSCRHYCRLPSGGGRKHFLKCGLLEANWTHGPGTDIKAGSPACCLWERGG